MTAHGYAELTIEAVARAAGVTRPTIYRRWPGKSELAAAALRDAVPPLAERWTDDPLDDLLTVAIDFVAAFVSSGYAGVALAIHAQARSDDDLATALFEKYLAPRADAIAALIGRAQRSGRIRDDLPADVVRDIVFGPLIYRWLIAGRPIDPVEARLLVSAACDGIRAPDADI